MQNLSIFMKYMLASTVVEEVFPMKNLLSSSKFLYYFDYFDIKTSFFFIFFFSSEGGAIKIICIPINSDMRWFLSEVLCKQAKEVQLREGELFFKFDSVQVEFRTVMRIRFWPKNCTSVPQTKGDF